MVEKKKQAERNKNYNEHFPYPRLDLNEKQIRVVRVLSGESHEKLRCEMKVIPLGKTHIALSYVWGNDRPSRFIEVNGLEFRVRPNLKSFLDHARRHLSGQWLWIDAMCIDQNNISERNHQVGQMVHVYSGARHVLIWFGRHYGAARNLLGMINSSCDTRLPSWKVWPRCRRLVHFRESILQLCEASYWSRLWIVPEVFNAKKLKIACSNGAIAWQRCMNFISAMRTDLYPEYRVDRALMATISESRLVALLDGWLVRHSNNDNNTNSFISLLVTYGHNGCSDPRDKAFVLGSLSQESEELQVDYGMTKTDLFNHVMSQVKAEGV